MIFGLYSVFHEMISKIIGLKGSSNDFADLFLLKLTPALFLILFVFSITRMVFFINISCATPLEWKENWNQFANEVCFIENTYMNQYINSSTDERIRLNYYQWMPYFFLLLAGLFCFPIALWMLICKCFRIDINHILKMCKEMKNQERKEINQGIQYVSNIFGNIYRLRKEHVEKKKNFFWSIKVWIDGKAMPLGYFIIKLIYAVNAFLILILIQHMIQAPSINFGWKMLANFINGFPWEESISFPRITWCDIQPEVHADIILAKIQCILPANSLYEKIFIGVWIWIMFGLMMIIISLIIWFIFLVRLFSGNYNHLHKQLLFMMYSMNISVKQNKIKDDTNPSLTNNSEEDLPSLNLQLTRENTELFLTEYLRSDGVFILKLIEDNFGDILLQSLLGMIWKMWYTFQIENQETSLDKNDGESN